MGNLGESMTNQSNPTRAGRYIRPDWLGIETGTAVDRKLVMNAEN